MHRTLTRALSLALVIVAIGLALAYRDRFDAAALTDWVAAAGPAAPVLFMGIYAAATVLFLPGSVLTLAGGALFGPVLGTLYNLTGATLGAALAFLISRHLGADRVRARAGGRVDRLIRGVEAEGWRFVAFTRLVPLFPFNLLNYVLGLTRIPFLHYLIATYLFMLPGALAYSYLGFAGREAVVGGEGLIQKVLIALALLATVMFIPRLVARLRRRPMLSVEELKQRIDQGNILVLDVRSPARYSGEGHIPGALNVPADQLAEGLGVLGDDPEQMIAVVCDSDRTAATSAALLIRKGFADVRVVEGGMPAWARNGWPLERYEPVQE